MPAPQEPDFPPGHPARCDYSPESAEAQAWAQKHVHPLGERDFPVGHPKAVDTEGSSNSVHWQPGVDPKHPEREAHSGRTPEQAEAHRALYLERAKQSKPSEALQPVVAPASVPRVSAPRVRRTGAGDGYEIYCPGCRQTHRFDSRWTFNGSLELPTFTPSLLYESGDTGGRCHSYVTNGQIYFLPDSGHALAGKTVELPPVGEAEETINGTRS